MNFARYKQIHATVVELADTRDLKSLAIRRMGSSPIGSTNAVAF